jgi:hypothetical protein
MKGKGARMTTLNLKRMFESVTYYILGLTESLGVNVCDVPVHKKDSVKKTILVSHQTTLIDHMEKEVL